MPIKINIVLPTETKPFTFSATQTARSIYCTVANMMSARIHYYKIFWSVIQSVAIYMMSNFFFGKRSSQFFHKDFSMFRDITIFVSKWMFRVKNITIAITKKLSSFPFFTSRTCNGFLLQFAPTFNRTGLTASLSKFPRHYTKWLTAYLTNYVGVFHTPISYTMPSSFAINIT